jgi:nucleotide-binding universal stress UspA family protein
MDGSRVVVGVSESLAGLQALRYAVQEARRRQSTVYAVRAWQFNAPWRGYDTDLCRQDLAAAADETLANAFDSAMGGIPDDLTVTLAVIEGEPAHALVVTAHRDDDLLVLGGSTRRFSFGASIVRHCVRRASCPVLVVPAPVLARNRRTRALTRQLHREVDAAVNGPM